MSYSLLIQAGWIVLRLDAEIDLQFTSEMKSELVGLFSAPQAGSSEPEGIIVDAEHVRYIDSSGIAVILFARDLCMRSARGFRLTVISPAVQHILSAAKLDRILVAERVASHPVVSGDDTA